MHNYPHANQILAGTDATNTAHQRAIPGPPEVHVAGWPCYRAGTIVQTGANMGLVGIRPEGVGQ